MLLTQGLETGRLAPHTGGDGPAGRLGDAAGARVKRAGSSTYQARPRALLLAVEVERIASAGLDVARDPGVERRDLKTITPAPTPIKNGRQGSFDETARAPRPMPNPAPTSVQGLRVDCNHMRLLMQQSSRVFVEKVL
jgi:hypothetical protein